MLREFASLLESEGQFPQFDAFLQHGSECWPQRLTSRFPTMARWQGLPILRQRILALCGVTTPATVLFASASRHLARVAFQMLSHRCERILCSDSDWPEFQAMLRQQLVQSGGYLHNINLTHPFLPDESRHGREYRLAAAWKKHNCDGALITAASADGLVTRVNRFVEAISKDVRSGFLVVDGSQQAGHMPIELGPEFHGIYVAGTHKWLRSGVPLSFGVVVHDRETPDAHMPIRRAIRLSLVDDSLLLQTADVGLENPRQTMRLEPLLAASLAIEHVPENRLQDMLTIRRRNAFRIFNMVTDLQLPLTPRACQGIVQLQCSGGNAQEIQQHLAEQGLTLSACSDHRLRISCPAKDFTPPEMNELWRIFGSLVDHYGPVQQQESELDEVQSVA